MAAILLYTELRGQAALCGMQRGPCVNSNQILPWLPEAHYSETGCQEAQCYPQKDFPRQDIEDELIVGIIGSLLFAALLLYRLSHGCRAIRLREKGISLANGVNLAVDLIVPGRNPSV